VLQSLQRDPVEIAAKLGDSIQPARAVIQAPAGTGRPACATDPAEQRHFEDSVSQLKAQLDPLTQDQREAQAAQTQADGELRTEQSKLDSLQDLLDGLDPSLAALDRGQSTNK